jgi:hypothetical protein
MQYTIPDLSGVVLLLCTWTASRFILPVHTAELREGVILLP